MLKQVSNKIIVSLCAGSGAWERPYVEAGYDVISITLPDYDILKTEIRSQYGDIIFKGKRKLIVGSNDIYGVLAAPPCTEFSFAKSNSKYPRDMRSGMEVVIACLKIIWEVQYNLLTPLAKRTNLTFWALENPMGLLKRYLGNPAFRFNPYDFGDPYKKDTGLWGYFNFPKKNPCKEYSKDFIHTISPSGKPLKKFDHLLTKEIHPEFYGKLTKQERRAITPQGFAKAFFK